ncbi:MAG: hypothetical protein LBP21_00020 [Synergistaceae bacterium]|jgi:uncharacterized Zn finger protein|nr:hypothetical protein [Synergistaceae bacterium]
MSKELTFYDEVKKKLKGRSQEELLELLAEVAEDNWKAGYFILERAMLDSGNIKKFVKSLVAEIRRLASEPVWSRRWQDGARLPDYSHLKQQFLLLEKRGYADALLELGEELWERGNEQLGKADDEGETGSAIEECMAIALRAAPKSSRSRPEQLLWAIELESTDNYGILAAAHFDFIKSGEYSEGDWREVAQALEERVSAMPPEWPRDNFVNWLVQAYTAGGLRERIIPLHQREGKYPQLVDALLSEGQREEAKKQCLIGYEKALEAGNYYTEGLHKRLGEMAWADGRFDLAAAYRWEEFYASPSDESYVELRDAAEKAGAWPAVRKAALHLLETGARLDQSETKKGGRWPLPPTEVPPLKKEHCDSFPDLESLIRIAILEGRCEDLIELFGALPQDLVRRGLGDYEDFGLNDAVATALSDKYPDAALAIWRSMADTLLDRVRPADHKITISILERMKSLYEEKNRLAEWKALLAELKTTYKRHRALLKALTVLE